MSVRFIDSFKCICCYIPATGANRHEQAIKLLDFEKNVQKVELHTGEGYKKTLN